MARPRKVQTGDLPPQPDPRAALDGAAFLRAARPVLAALTADLLARADADAGVLQALQRRHQAERAASRTAEDFPVWRRSVVVQVAAAWLLSCVFVRVLEDRGLVPPRIAGPGARDSEDAFFRIAPFLGPREYLLTVFRELTRQPAAKPLFDAKHNLVWALGPSAEACKQLLALFRGPHIDTPAFRFGQQDTRFLGDLYQDLDDGVRETYALLQTPDFVERFILDRTLEPALREYKVEHTDLIDPTCGSGHFLLGAFPRFMRELRLASPGLDDRTLAGTALAHLYGADINPYAVAIARFRLTLQFLETAGFDRLRGAPAPILNVVVADSLYYGFAGGQGDLGERPTETPEQAAAWYGQGFSLEDPEAARRVLVDRTYAAVVGNPPYITVKDPALRETYRDKYESAAGKYALSAPFMERFFQLAKQGGGYVGQITSNSFTKREFGAALIEEVLPDLDLELVVNTAGAFIPGHGTPTILVFGRNRKPVGDQVDAVLAKRGEPGIPPIPAEGHVWRSIAEHWNEEKFENDYISVEKLSRATLKVHPWALEGGGAGKLKILLEEKKTVKKEGDEEPVKRATLNNITANIGIGGVTGEDDVYVMSESEAQRLNVGSHRVLVTGEMLRDWSNSSSDVTVFPYNIETLELHDESDADLTLRFLWSYRAVISRRKRFGTPMLERGLTWYELQELYTDKFRTPLTITYAEVATHNHFVLDRGGKVFKQTAPIIKLPADATEFDHLALLAYLNSSTACFWMKQVSYPKGMHNGSEANSTPFLVRYAFNATQVGQLPLPSVDWKAVDDEARTRLARYAGEIDRLLTRRREIDFTTALAECAHPTIEALGDAVQAALSRREDCLHRSIALQEEIDWLVYKLFGLSTLDTIDSEYRLRPGERPFEIRLAQDDPIAAAEGWFRWSQIAPVTEIPAHLGGEIEARLNERIAATRASKFLRMLESPENKRRWRQPAGKAAQELETDDKIFRDQAANWLAERIEDLFKHMLTDVPAPGVLTSRDITRQAQQDSELLRVLEWLHPNSDVAAFISDQLARESVPFLAGWRYSPSGRDRHDQWRAVWDYQRLADRLEAELPRLRAAFDAASAAAREADTRVTAERRKLRAAAFALAPPDPSAPRRGRKPRSTESEPEPTADTGPKSPELLAAEEAEAAARAAQNATRLDLEEAEAFHRKARAFIPVPQKYEPSDFRDPAYFRLRGKLDVPRERFIAYPGAASNHDPAPVYGWAGWTHLQRALALLALYYERKLQETWTDRLVPLLAGLQELLPWVAQWHGDEVHPDTGERYVDVLETHIIAGCTELGVTRPQLDAWTPPDTRSARVPRKADDEPAADKPRRTRKPDAETGEDSPGTPAPAKRRGRPPKIDPVPEDTSETPPAPQRRGRPPKSAPAPGDMSEAPPAPKRRGRPPKAAPE